MSGTVESDWRLGRGAELCHQLLTANQREVGQVVGTAEVQQPAAGR